MSQPLHEETTKTSFQPYQLDVDVCSNQRVTDLFQHFIDNFIIDDSGINLEWLM